MTRRLLGLVLGNVALHTESVRDGEGYTQKSRDAAGPFELLFKSAVDRRLDLRAKSVEKTIRSGALITAGFLNGSQIFL